jgi:hypothetical protein
MKDGIIEFMDPRSVSDEMRREIQNYGEDYSFKRFDEGVNFSIELV